MKQVLFVGACFLALSSGWTNGLRSPIAVQDSKAESRASDADRAAIGSLLEWMNREMSPVGPTESRSRERKNLSDVFAPRALIHALGGGAWGAVTPDVWLKTLRREGANFWTFIEIARHIDLYGDLAQAFTTYEAKAAIKDRFPQARGITSVQLLKGSDGWRIVSVACSHEERADQPIPAEFLPK